MIVGEENGRGPKAYVLPRTPGASPWDRSPEGELLSVKTCSSAFPVRISHFDTSTLIHLTQNEIAGTFPLIFK